jgi:hypothetical protein
VSDQFGLRLSFALKAFSMSRGRLAMELGVDKSLVGRWASGGTRPSAHNLERLTHHLAGRRPGLTLLDWERPLPEFAALLGVEMGSQGTDQADGGLSGALADVVRHSVESQVSAYEGFWRSTHASVFEPGRFCQQHGIIQRGAGGGLQFEIGADGIRYGGAMYAVEGQVFGIANDSVRNVPSFLILNVVAAPKITLLDGLLIAASSSLRVPTAYSIIFERVGDLSGDRICDTARAAAMMERPEFVEDPALLPDVVRSHLLRDFGPQAAARGGEMMLTASLTPRLAQIMALSGRPPGEVGARPEDG